MDILPSTYLSSTDHTGRAMVCTINELPKHVKVMVHFLDRKIGQHVEAYASRLETHRHPEVIVESVTVRIRRREQNTEAVSEFIFEVNQRLPKRKEMITFNGYD